MTDAQATVLAIIRQRGEMRTVDLTTYQHRSLYALWRDGHILFDTCGQCNDCQYSDRHHEERWLRCFHTKVRPTNPMRKK